MYYFNRKRQNYEMNSILWKIEQIVQNISKLQEISLLSKCVK